jgi:hypothetical protein
LVGKNLSAGLPKLQEILGIIENLKPGDRVVVFWRDACGVTNDPEVRAEYYATSKETQGTVCDVRPDPEYPWFYYLIIGGETTGGLRDYYDSVPIAWIVKIERLEVAITKHTKKAPKLVTEEYVVNRVMRFANLPHNSDKTPQKFVEEIRKVVEPDSG